MTATLRTGLLGCVVVAGIVACNPDQCVTDYRAAVYKGHLDVLTPPATQPEVLDSGAVFLGLNEFRGGAAQQSLHVAVNSLGVLDSVTAVHIHQGTPTNPGPLLWQSTQGFRLGDSIFNDTELFQGPGSWADLWNVLDQGGGYVEALSPTDSAPAGLRQVSKTPFGPTCT
jgi:hypothetical protein